MEISNKILAIIVLLVLITSFSTTFFLLNISKTTNSPIGFVTDSKEGVVTLRVSDFISITLLSDVINFGSCSINSTHNYSYLDSNKSIQFVDNSQCTDGTFPDYLVLQNSGTVRANVTVEILENVSAFFNDNSSWLAFSTMNYSDISGCTGNLQPTYTNFTNASVSFNACSNLYSANEFNFSLSAFVSDQASGGGSLAILFTGVEAD